MIPPVLSLPPEPAAVQAALRLAQGRLAAALWLSAGMFLAVGSLACAALGWRRAALVCGLGYSATLCLLPGGRAPVLGPLGLAFCLVGLARPRRR